jgi:hypothetical protein
MGFMFSPRALVFALTAPLVLALSASLRAADSPGKAGAPQTVRFLAPASEAETEYIFVSPPEGGRPIKLLLTGDAKKKFGALFQHRDELIDITVKPGGGQATDMVTSLSSFKGPAGMKSPRAYIFDGLSERKLGTQSQPVIKLSRFGQTKEAVISNRPGPGGKSGPDAVLLERVKGLKEGDCVEVELGPGGGRESLKLLDIDSYREPVLAEFVKAQTAKVGTRPMPAIVLNVADEEKTFLLPSHLPLTPGEQAIVTLSRRLKPGYYVRFTTRDEGDHSTLASLSVDGRMRMTFGGAYDFESTFMGVEFHGRATMVAAFHTQWFGRPDDQRVETGLRKALWSSTTAGPLNLKPELVVKLKDMVNNNPPYRLPEDLRVREQGMWVKAYEAWQNARSNAERDRIEQEMALAAQELGKPWKEQAEGRMILLKSFLDDKQLAKVREMGQRPELPLD